MSKGLGGPQICEITGLTQRQVTTTIERIRRYGRRGDYDHG
jgi:hypothetical protein